ncbi:phosphoglycerate mutase [Pseudomonas brassicacearum]|uniref:Phosphoglycerate mutase n=1 Tax=Pseudomonas brassicacearum TaxID=930166 RepID=A0A423H787_9PSED|nr:histidine phosphatase family protein [Pseudomonas brassicacearum]RON09055.1 phosphoglycerate mutase [Pseudomonas brassicacearum]
MPVTRLTLICHARTVAQKLARFPMDEPLEMDWQAVKGSRSGCFKRAPQLLGGPETRIRQTAELFGSDLQIVPALGDYDVGRWRGQRIDDLQKTEPEALHTWLGDPASAPHGGESVTQLCLRVGDWLDALCTTPGHFVAITHPFVIRAALMKVMQCGPEAFNLIDVEPLSATELRFNGRWRLRLLDTTAHSEVKHP